MKKCLLLLLMVMAGSVFAEAPPTVKRISASADAPELQFGQAIVNGVFYTGSFNWIWQAGSSGSLSMRGHSSTANGGTIKQVTVCLFSESSFSRFFRARASVVQGTRTIQAIDFARSFPPTASTCHTLNGFNATLEPGDFAIVASYNKFDSDNIFAGFPSTDSGQVFDVQIGSSRPPFATGSQGQIQIRGVGLKYRLEENDAPPPPPPPPTPEPLCVSDSYTACLLAGRFKVAATWQTTTSSGRAQVMHFNGTRAENDQSVFMWFFNDRNFEMGIKMVDACATPSNKFWAFVSGLTNQAFTVSIEDTETGALWTHSNPLGELPATRGDNAAFDCP